MNIDCDRDFVGDAILSCEEIATPIAVWSLDELDLYTDLDSIRSAWTHTDGARA